MHFIRRQTIRVVVIALGIASFASSAFAVDPVVGAKSVPNVTAAGANTYSFTVHYSDDGDVNDGSITNGNIHVTGPSGYEASAALVSITLTSSARNHYDATYLVIPPGGSWDPADNGTYTLVMQPGQVTDSLNNYVKAGPFATFTVSISGSPINSAQALNLSTRLQVQTGQNVLIGGFIVVGTSAKKVIVRAIGPSLAASGINGSLADPVIELYGPGGLLANNNDWNDTQAAEVEATGIAPKDQRESAIVISLAPGAYTAIVKGNGDTTGVGLVEVYDLDQAASSSLANISTRGVVGTGSDVMIAGFIAGNGNGQATIVARALGPSLAAAGINGFLADPTLELRNSSGDLLGSNNNWKETQRAEVTASGLQLSKDAESALFVSVGPGAYTAIVRGNNRGTGTALVEIYRLQ